MTANVVFPLPLDHSFSYLIPEALEAEAQVGCRVSAPFRGRHLTGVITERTDADGAGRRLKPLINVLDAEPALSGELLRLSRWMADYYVCGWGEVLRAALPRGMDSLETLHIKRTDADPGDWREHPHAAPLLRYLEHHAEATPGGLRQVGIDIPMALLYRIERDGVIVTDKTLDGPKVRIKYARYVRLAPSFREPGGTRDLLAQLRGPKQKAVIETLADLARRGQATTPKKDLLQRTQASSSTIERLIARGVLEGSRQEVIRAPTFASTTEEPGAPPLHHEAQRTALKHIGAALAQGKFAPFLLHGVTGSGKTEVYMAALGVVLKRGQTGIVLVPEISLTPQTVRRFRARFGDKVAVLHSRMSLGERYDAWRHLRSGRYSVAIGPRSAILAPLANLGLIVVDEEHDHSYKQLDPAPRYHARDVAVMRAQMRQAVCILGSATPSLESLYNAQYGKYKLLEMMERVPIPGHAAAPPPKVFVIDLAVERKKRQLHGALSNPLREAIKERLQRKEQVILLQNRRGYAPVLECQACGFVPECIDCSVTLTYHKPLQNLRCHYCGRTRRVFDTCPKCNSTDLSRLGAGTQRVEEELEDVFPDARVARMDLDSTYRKNAHHDILDRFGRGDADILVGTQMVAKGLDFKRVTLVGVISADVGMRLPDFRAEERTFQLLMQVSGRAGRAELRGEVMLQTRRPKHPVFRHILAHDYGCFAQIMMQEREALLYPPFGRIVGVEFKGPNEERASRVAERWKVLLCKELGGGLDILGPELAFIAKVKNQYRFHIMIKVPKGARGLQDALRRTIKTFGKPPRGYRVAVNVDAIGVF